MKIKPEYIIGFFIIAVLAIFSYSHIIPLIIIGCGILIAIFLILSTTNKEDFNFLFLLFIISYIARLIIGTFVYEYRLFNGEWGFLGDGYPYVYNGNIIADMWVAGFRDFSYIVNYMLSISGSGTLGFYDFWNAFVLFFSDRNLISLAYINSLAGSLVVIFIYHITKQLYDKKSAKVAAFLTAFWPSMFTWSIQNFKEPISVFLIVVLMWAILKLNIKFRFYLVFLIIFLSMALKEFRGIVFFVLYAIALPISLTFSLFNKHKIIFTLLTITILLLVILFMNHMRHNLFSLTTLAPSKAGDFSLLQWIYERKMERAYGNTAFLPNLDITNPVSFIFFAFTALLTVWLAPFPWQIGSMSQMIVMPEMLLYYLLLPVMVSGLGFIMRHKIREGGIIAVYIFIMMLVLAFIEGNIGTLFRHRAMVLPFMFILVGIGLAKMKFKITAHN